MNQTENRRIPLHALSESQRRTLEAQLPLVPRTLSRSFRRRQPWRQLADYEDLLQEGCLALVEAFLHHEPIRHGCFAAYAMARVHYAVAKYLHETASLLRIPFISRRRQRTQKSALGRTRYPSHQRSRRRIGAGMVDASASTHGASFEALFELAAHCEPLVRQLTGAVENTPGRTIADVVQQRYHRAAIQAARELKRRLRRKPDAARLVDLCYRMRWTVPDADARASLRRIADQIGCSVGRVVYTESAFHRLIRRRLLIDKNLKRAISPGRRGPEE